jgi:hypothetical protein
MMWCCEVVDDVAVLKTGLPKRKQAPALFARGPEGRRLSPWSTVVSMKAPQKGPETPAKI